MWKFWDSDDFFLYDLCSFHDILFLLIKVNIFHMFSLTHPKKWFEMFQ